MVDSSRLYSSAALATVTTYTLSCVSFLMGVMGGIPATARHLAFQASNVPAGARWKVIGISRAQWPRKALRPRLGLSRHDPPRRTQFRGRA